MNRSKRIAKPDDMIVEKFRLQDGLMLQTQRELTELGCCRCDKLFYVLRFEPPKVRFCPFCGFELTGKSIRRGDIEQEKLNERAN